jgi:hypothetical protein
MKANARFLLILLTAAIAVAVLFMILKSILSAPIPVTQTPTALPPTNQIKTWNENLTVTLVMDTTGNLSSEEIVRSLFEKWLNQFQPDGIPDNYKLDGCQIDNVTVYSMDINGLAKANDMDFVAKISYSVKPHTSNATHWCAGDGTPGNDGWINLKVEWVVIKKVDNLYILKALGPCPTC